MLKVDHLTAGYAKGPDIIHDVHLHVEEGEIVTILGPNGAGKSTILKSIFGLTDVRSGTILHGARELHLLPTDEILRSGIGFVMQGQNIFPDMTVEENLEMAAWILKTTVEITAKKEEVFRLFPVVKRMRKMKSLLLSGGERQMVAFGMAMMLSPEVLLLDEPSIGLAPKVVHEVFQKVQHVREEGTSVLMVEQNAAAALKISDRGYVLENGRNVLDGDGKTLLRDKRVGELYLGHSST